VDAPFISQEPEDQLVLLGEAATFTVGVIGVSLTYQWRQNGVSLMDVAGDIIGSNTSSLTVYNVSDANLGVYSCAISNMAAEVATRNATLALGKG